LITHYFISHQKKIKELEVILNFPITKKKNKGNVNFAKMF
jgi:hypothetical protein